MKLTHEFNSRILKAYDIRGIVGEEIKDTDPYFVGRTFATVVKRKGGKLITLGFDGRADSEKFSKEVARGMNDCGINVINIGLVPTPVLYFSVPHFKSDAGLMITASHNPKEFNGFKMLLKDRPFFGNDIQELGKMAIAGDFEDGKGSTKEVDIKDIYLDRILEDYKPAKNLNVIWDCGNGAAGEITEMLLKRLDGKHIGLYTEIDGDFPNHSADPSKAKNLLELQKQVKENDEYDLGIGFDGDGDRIGVIDSEGNFIPHDFILMLFAQETLKIHPGSAVVSEVKASKDFYDQVEKWGGKPIMSKTGHSSIKTIMKESGAWFAGETSGHMCFRENYNFDDGIYAALRFVAIVSRFNKPLHEVIADLPHSFATPGMRIPVGHDRKFEIIEEIRERLDKEGAEYFDIDGMRVNTPDGWWLARTSQTEAVITCRCESSTKEGLKRVVTELQKHLDASNVDYKVEV